MCNTSQDNNVLQNFPRLWEEIHLKLARLIEQLLKSAATTPTTPRVHSQSGQEKREL